MCHYNTIQTFDFLFIMPFERKLSVNFIDELRDQFGNNIDASHVKKFATAQGCAYPTVARKLKAFQVKKGTWNLTIEEGREILEKAIASPTVLPTVEQNLIPQVDETFVKFGNFPDVKKIIASKIFYPAFITGLSGNGKTFSVEQACAQTGRELIRVNISIETDEDDLIGGFRLVDGNTVWHNGPVVEALQRGAVLLLDEIDLASNKILCLQSILEGKGVFLKKIGKYIKPAAGFTYLPIFLRKTPLPSRIDCKHKILLDARSISSRSRTAPLSSASTTGPLCHTVLPSTSLNPPIRSSSSVSIEMLTLINSLFALAHACSTENVLPLPDRPVMNAG